MIIFRTQPSPDMEAILRKFKPSIREDILANQGKLSDKFISAYCNGEENAVDFAKQRLDHGVRLFYRIFESIIKSEASRCSDFALKNMVSNVDFISATFAMSLEVVLNSYGSSERKFPWILNALGLHSFFVGRVIETIIMHDTGWFQCRYRFLVNKLSTYCQQVVDFFFNKLSTSCQQVVDFLSTSC